jgi:Holliday junction resolvase-like predicted endonuclease
MPQIGLWQVTGEGPRKLDRSDIDFERYLEDWIEQDPSLLQRGLKIIGRQIELEGGRLDLLALDPEGHWVVIEIKRGAVHRETIAQALDYAASIARIPQDDLARKVDGYLHKRATSLQALMDELGIEEDAQEGMRDIFTYVVGTGKGSGLDRIVDYLAGTFEVPISVVLYEVFKFDDGRQVLVRELTDSETIPSIASRARRTVEEVCALADRTGLGREFRRLLEAAQEHDLYPAPYKKRIRYAPPANRTRTLFTAQASPTAGESALWVYVQPEAFAEFYPVTEEVAISILGPAGWHEMAPSDIDGFVANLTQLFERIESKS